MKNWIRPLIIIIFLQIAGELSSQSLVGKYNFNNTSADRSTRNNYLSREGDTIPTYQEANCRTYLDFTGSGYLRGDMPDVSLNPEFTIAFWMRAQDVSSDQKIIGQTNSINKGFVIGIQDSKIKAEIFGPSQVLEAPLPLQSTGWTHVAMTINNTIDSSWQIYVNGSLSQSKVLTQLWSPPIDSLDDVIVGAAPWDPEELEYGGDLDELMIYNTVLSIDEIRDIYNTGTQPIYVGPSGTSSANTGTSWADAFIDLQAAIDFSSTCHNPEIWLREGVYSPTEARSNSADDRDKTFHIERPLKIYGGFEGSEDKLDERNIMEHPSVLSGIINGGSDTVYTVVSMSGSNINEQWVLDGLNIQNGKSKGTGFSNVNGGGLDISSSSIRNPIIRLCKFVDNYASQNGGAIYLSGQSSELTVINCFFENNQAGSQGGAIRLSGFGSELLTDHSTFYNNTASNGGAIYIASDFSNVTDVIIRNSIFWNNTASINGNDLYVDHGSDKVIISNSIFSSDGIHVEDNMDIDTGTFFLHTDPLLDTNLRPTTGSPVINNGHNDALASVIDIDNHPRLKGSTVDIGAYEYGLDDNCDQNVFLAPQVFYDAYDMYNTDEAFYASNKIISDIIIYNGLLGVELGPQFEVSKGALFEARIDGCP